MAKDKVIIKNLLLRGIIGVNDWEREKEQDILINVTLSTDTRQAAADDDVEASVNYRTITKSIVALVQNSNPLTVEKLAADIAALCFKIQRVEEARVRVEKPGAVRFADSVGVEIVRKRDE